MPLKMKINVERNRLSSGNQNQTKISISNFPVLRNKSVKLKYVQNLYLELKF